METVLVTGISSDLGFQIALEFAKGGYKIIGTYNKNKNKALNKKNILEKYSKDVKIYKCDITNENDIKNVFNNKIDIVINNASICNDDEIINKNKEDFINVLNVNLVGAHQVCKEAINNNVKCIINISSTDSIDTYTTLNVDYSASKAGINILTKVISLSYPHIKTFAVLPNWINTDTILNMNQEYLNMELKRIGQEKLLDKCDVAKKIYDLYKDDTLENGCLIRFDYEGGLCTKILK